MSAERVVRYIETANAAALAPELAAGLGSDTLACVPNLEYAYAPYDIYPLAPCVRPPLKRIVAFATDMDGTSTTTEPLALHSLEYMVRRFTGLRTQDAWPGLDERRDHPHVIGNSNYRHTEFLVQRYRDRLDPAALRGAFFEALLWTLASMDDPQRLRDIRETARKCGLSGMLADADSHKVVQRGGFDEAEAARRAEPWLRKYGGAFHTTHTGELVSAALDVYYYRYHAILRAVEKGAGDALSAELLGDADAHLIAPMPGYDVFLALARGWLGADAGRLYDLLRADLPASDDSDPNAEKRRLVRLGETLERTPARVALVTASISYEAHVTMKEVIRLVAERAASWPIGNGRKDRIAARLADYEAAFDAFVTASDACEHRLKPHPDLYSLALHRMSVPRQQYGLCVGLEDTEPGIVALRAAGIGCAVALPNRDTRRQDYSAAAVIIRGGLPELLLRHDLVAQES